jgi:eukaryotic-like serine/threonine-protein kinase
MNWSKGTLLKSGRYKIIRDHSRGASAIIYLAEDQTSGQKVAIKVPKNESLDHEIYKQFQQQFQHEKQILDKVSDRNVVRAIEYFEDKSIPCLVLEFVEGNTLDQSIQNNIGMPEDEAVRCFRQLAQSSPRGYRSLRSPA